MIEVVVGVVGRAHGLSGEVAVEVRTDEPELRFAVGAELWPQSGGPPWTVLARRWHQGRLLLRLSGSSDRTAAAALTGSVLLARVDPDRSPQDQDEFYDHQLIGLTAVTEAGRTVGQVERVSHGPAQDLLQLTTPAGPRWVPFVAALVTRVDLAQRRLVLAELAGLLDDDTAEEAW
ncbi:MAG: ribosome maturation factor RimM [Propionibacteriaceae bacterium]|jgi:16S rRNA processing protein RimM|nr:ribosome maturation factor RimM [Propionibacteriaceae bacterium]